MVGMATYNITGPLTIGSSSSLTNLLGNVLLSDIGTQQGSLYFSGSSGNLESLPPGTPGQILTTEGPSSNPKWVNKSGETTIGFSVAKQIPLHFAETEVTIGDWTSTSPNPNLSGNPFFNTGVPDFNLITGLFYVSITGTYLVDACIQYTNTSPAHGNLKTLKFCEASSTPINEPIVTVGPKQGTPDTSSTQILNLKQNILLKAGSVYALRIQASTSDAVNIITTESRFSATLQSQ